MNRPLDGLKLIKRRHTGFIGDDILAAPHCLDGQCRPVAWHGGGDDHLDGGIIQQPFLPKTVPDRPSWHVAAFYRPARTVGGDFYDFITLPDGRVMFVVGDVTDKGVPAALVMASTHALLRGRHVAVALSQSERTGTAGEGVPPVMAKGAVSSI